MKKLITPLLFAVMFFGKLSAQQPGAKDTDAKKQKMEWFANAKLGIFIHWGIYSVNGISESWSFFNNYINHDNYMKQLNGFTAANYHPEEWVKLIKESGAKYTVITTKHHDGVSLWDTKGIDATTTLKNSAAKKDVITPFVKEVKKAGLKTGIYFSLPDWGYPDYDGFTRDRKRYKLNEEPKRWDKFQTYLHTQMNEISLNFKPDLLWFDGDWEHSAEEWQAGKISSDLKKHNPNIIINSRLNHHGDYETPEQGIPVLRPNSEYWELCYTMNDSWGYQPYDFKYKSPNMIVRTLVDCISMGGNLLLDIGPKADGTIAAEQVNILKGLGRWTKKHAEAIYGTHAGLPAGHFNGKTALSADKKTLYLYADWIPDNGGLLLSGIKPAVRSAKIVGSDLKATFVNNGENISVKIPAAAADKDVTVIALKFDSPVEVTNEPLVTLSFKDLVDKNVDYKAQINSIARSISNGTNPFKDSDLSADGMDFKSGKKELKPEVFNWVTKNAESLYKTDKGLPEGHYQGLSALSADKQTVYLFVEGKPTGPIALKGIKNKISRIRIVGEGTMVEPEIYNKLYWSSVPGIVYIPLPTDRLDKDLTVVAVLLDGPLDLYREKVGAIESNL
ncbi:alpha-L-fucosidase [Pedobacter ginsengisoli]|uniref:alpha-L-fucosidase n=1 Tax=Pedobacter ginsengisoli TaxID=363852 RepID=A0A2D1U1V2_9SPHI|nr:alpha-L-fucosidase [Pedobacter ginsengisoli]ATP55484.1 alpha-L-fucosidase [Pedobacter ginsengisoli]